MGCIAALMRAKASLRLRAGCTSGLRLVLLPASESRRVCLRLPPSTCPNLARIAPAGFIRSHSVSTSRSRPIKPGGGLISSGLGIFGATSLRVNGGEKRLGGAGRYHPHANNESHRREMGFNESNHQISASVVKIVGVFAEAAAVQPV